MITTIMTMKTTRMMTTTMKKVSQLWVLIDTWGFPEDIKDMDDDDDNNNYNDGKDDHNYSTTESTSRTPTTMMTPKTTTTTKMTTMANVYRPQGFLQGHQ